MEKSLPRPKKALKHKKPKARGLATTRPAAYGGAFIDCPVFHLDADVPPIHVLGPDQAMRDLRDITLDGQVLSGIDFTGTDLRGANISDALVYGSIFSHADLVDVCLSDSVFEDCDFSHVRFGATIIRGARFINCRFAGPSCFLLPWNDALEMVGNTYMTACGQTIPLDHGPFVLWGAPDLIASLGDVTLVNDRVGVLA